MARIRTVKPEFWDSPGIETLNPYWRLLYMAMWNWADDSGKGKAEARELMGFVFPRDEDMTVAEFRRGLGEVRRVFGVIFYKVDGRSYYAIPSWNRHQKIDKRSASRWPSPDEGDEYDPSGNDQASPPFGESSENTRRESVGTRRESGAGTGEQGNRGTEERTPRPPVNETTHLPARTTSKREANLQALNATAHSGEAHAIAKAFADSCDGMPSRLLGQVAAQIDHCLNAGHDPHRIAVGLQDWIKSDSWSANQIETFVFKAGAKKLNNKLGKPSAKAMSYQDAAEQLLAEVRTIA